MIEDIELQNQAEFLYQAAAKQLYNLALYTVGNQTLAEQITIDAFDGAFCSIPDKSDAERFTKQSIKLLYRYGRKMRRKAGYNISDMMFSKKAESGKVERRDNVEKKRLFEMLSKLSYDERYILLLFCWQRFSAREIADIMRLQLFFSKRRIYVTINKTAAELPKI